MTPAQAAILGILQGVTEFFPISSSGHLVIAQKLFHLQSPPVFFDIVVHLGTLTAVIFFLRKEVVRLTKTKLTAILIGSIPAGILGLSLNSVKNQLFDSLTIVAFGLLITSFFLIYSKKIPRKKNTKTIKPVNAIIIGLAQGIAIIPGISRSGSTIITGLQLGLNRRQALEFSFLLAIPAVIAAQILQLPDISLSNSETINSLVIGFTAAVFTGFFSLKALRFIISQKRLYLFALYTLPLVIITLILEKVLIS